MISDPTGGRSSPPIWEHHALPSKVELDLFFLTLNDGLRYDRLLDFLLFNTNREFFLALLLLALELRGVLVIRLKYGHFLLCKIDVL
jgi:hypothetical protein